MIGALVRDQLFTGAWLGLMTMVWFGWAQEAPPAAWRLRLGIGSGMGTLLAVGLAVAVVLNWDLPSALEGRYQWFGALVAAEVVLAGAGAFLLARRGAGRWTAWWIAVVVAAHFGPLALLLQDGLLAIVGAVQLIGLLVLLVRLRGRTGTTSFPVGLLMGSTFLLAAITYGTIGLTRLAG